MTPRPLLRRLARHPVLHFAGVGAVLFALRGALPPPADGAAAASTRAPVVVSAAQVRLLRSEFERRWGAPPSAPQLRALVDRSMEEEMLYREARLLALDFQDRSVRRRLVEKARAVRQQPGESLDELQADALALGFDDDLVIRRLLAEKMRLVLQREPGEAPIDAAEMVAYLERHRSRFAQPETITLTQVFFSAQARGDRLAGDVAAALAALQGQPPSPGVLAQSDPFPLGAHLRAYVPRQLMARFGKPFADRVLALPPGRWSEPLVSPYGLHLVWVDQHQPERLPPLDAVRETVTLALTQERAARNLQVGLARLRSLYAPRLETPLPAAGEPS